MHRISDKESVRRGFNGEFRKSLKLAGQHGQERTKVLNASQGALDGDRNAKADELGFIGTTGSLRGQRASAAEGTRSRNQGMRTINPSSRVCQSNHSGTFSRVIDGASARVRRNRAASSSAACNNGPCSVTWAEVSRPRDVGSGAEGSGMDMACVRQKKHAAGRTTI